ncbi:MAG: flippase [Bacteroidetes bacterium]|nr:flippase [Bacteroidota bacterium]
MARKGLFTDIMSVMSSNVVAIASALAVNIILSRQLGPAGFGIYTVIMVVPMIVISLVQLGIRASAIYHIGKEKENTSRFVSAIMAVLLISSFAGMLISGGTFFFMGREEHGTAIILTVMFIIPAHLAALFSGGIFLGQEQIRRANIIRWLPVLLDLILVVVFVYFLKWKVQGALLALLIAYAAVSSWAIITVNREHPAGIRFDLPVIKRIVGKGIVFAMAFFIIQLNYRIDILILESLTTAQEVGYYSLGVSIGEVLWQLPLAIGIVLMSRTANAEDQDEMNITTAKLLRLSFLAALLASIVLFLLAPVLVPLIWGKEFLPSVPLLQYILPGILFFSVFRIIGSRLSGIGKPEIAIYVFAPALVLNVILNYWWIPLYGAMGAVMATNASYILGSVAFLIVYSNVVGMPVREIVKYRISDFRFFTRDYTD